MHRMRLPLLAAVMAILLTAGSASEQQMIAQFEKDLTAVSAKLVEKPENITALSRAGDLHLFLQQYPQAVAAFEKTIALDPAQDAPHWRLGIAYYFAGQYEKSSRQFAKYHAYDARDRENGVWKFLADARLSGIEKARGGMLEYTRFDREPFPALYEMFAGKRTPESVIEHVAAPELAEGSAGAVLRALLRRPDERPHRRPRGGRGSPEESRGDLHARHCTGRRAGLHVAGRAPASRGTQQAGSYATPLKFGSSSPGNSPVLSANSSTGVPIRLSIER